MLHKWKESDFEKWFLDNPFLPNKEKVLIIDRQRPLRRVVDLLALDKDGALVIIEVKNEPSTRTVVGQALEYLAHYQPNDVSADEFTEMYKECWPKSRDTLYEAFAKTFVGENLSSISPIRRVYIAGPSFDAYSAICIRYLQKQLEPGNVHLNLLQATKGRSGFNLRICSGPPYVRGAQLTEGKFYMSHGGFIYTVLSKGESPLLWKIGRERKGRFVQLRGTRAKHLLKSRRALAQIAPPEGSSIDLDLTGTTWMHKNGRFTAKVIGGVSHDGKGHRSRKVVIAKFKSDSKAHQFNNFSVRQFESFKKKYHKEKLSLPEWSDILAGVELAGPK